MLLLFSIFLNNLTYNRIFSGCFYPPSHSHYKKTAPMPGAVCRLYLLKFKEALY